MRKLCWLRAPRCPGRTRLDARKGVVLRVSDSPTSPFPLSYLQGEQGQGNDFLALPGLFLQVKEGGVLPDGSFFAPLTAFKTWLLVSATV